MVRLRYWNREITVRLTNSSGSLEIRGFECCKTITGSSDRMLGAMAKLGIVSFGALIASAFKCRGYEKALEIKRC